MMRAFALCTTLLVAACAQAPPPATPPVEAAPAAGATTESAPAAAATPAAEAPKPLTNRIRWSTASEVDNFGFDVYRGEAEEGPFTRLTPQPIAGGGTKDTPSSYEFIDTTNDPAKAYWYYVESISMGGERERFTPVQRVGPKRPGGTS